MAVPSIEAEPARAGQRVLRVSGEWELAHAARMQRSVRDAAKRSGEAEAVLDLGGVERIDSAGALLLLDLLPGVEAGDLPRYLQGSAEVQSTFLVTIKRALQQERVAQEPPGYALFELLSRCGEWTYRAVGQAALLLHFVGLVMKTALRNLFRPRRLRWTALVFHMESVGLDAIPIVGLLSFMVGAVVAYLGATVLGDFGAQIFTVELVAYSFLREFGVLLSAILIAGRSGSAFTAQLGSMKSNEEIDALSTLGLDPIDMLVMPRLMALLLMLPALTFIAYLFGLFGGGLVAALSLDISPGMFLNRLQENIPLRHFWVGLIKAPVFAFMIAVVGCLEGFKVAGSAESVGRHTTSSVVQSIFLVILADAFFAVFFMEMGW